MLKQNVHRVGRIQFFPKTAQVGAHVVFHIGALRPQGQAQIHIVDRRSTAARTGMASPGQAVKSRSVPILVVVQYDAVHIAQKGKSPRVFLAFFAMGGKSLQAISVSPPRFQHVGGKRIVVQHGAAAHVEHCVVGQARAGIDAMDTQATRLP